MNTREYIESGIIEQFVLGETNREQTREVMAYAKQYPEIQAEIEAVENTLIDLAERNSNAPKERTREQLFDKLFNGNPAVNAKGTNTASISKPMTMNKKYLVAASVALLASAILNIFLYMRLKDSENELMVLNSEKQQFATIMASEKTNYMALQEQMDKMNSEDMIRVKLSGSELMPDARAMVYYNMQNKEVYLHIGKLPAAPENKQYQLWAIVNGIPVDAGVFDAEGLNVPLHKMKNSNPPAAFAVTIEKKGGSVNPTLEKMVLIGNVSS